MALLQAFLVLPLLATACAGEVDDSNPSVLQLPADADAGVATSTALAYTVYPANGTLPAGQDLVQAERLYSFDGSVFLVPQTDGNLVLYNAYAVAQLGHTAAQAAIWNTATYVNPGPQPFVLAMQQDCNLVLYNGHAANNGPRNAGDAVFNTATYNQGVPPCSCLVSDAGTGGVVVVDSAGAALFSTLRVLGIPPPFSTSTFPNVTAVVYDIVTGSWSSVGLLLPGGIFPGFSQTRLHDGRVLLAGGQNLTGPFGPQPVQNASLFLPSSLTFTATASMPTDRAYFPLLTAFNGSALAIGGLNYLLGGTDLRDRHNYATPAIDAFNPYTDTWSTVGSMLTGRAAHVSIVLSSGRVLTTGGYIYEFPIFYASSSAELYDPTLGVSSATGSMSTGRVFHQMVLLEDGTALACGGMNDPPNMGGPPGDYLFTCDLYDPSTGIWEPTGNMTMRTTQAAASIPPQPSAPWFDFTLSLLPNGKVLASGNPPQNGFVPGCVEQFNVYDPQTRTWSEPAPVPSFGGPQILLPTGKLLLVNSFTSVAQCQNSNFTTIYPPTFPATTVLYDPVTGSETVSGVVPGLSIASAVLI